MDLEQFGAYWRLLLHAWIEGSIPADETLLARLLGINHRKFRRIWEAVSRCWTVSENDPTRLIQRRQEAQRVQQTAFSVAQAARGANGGKSRVFNKTSKPALESGEAESKRSLSPRELSLPFPFPSPRTTPPPYPPASAGGSPVPQGDPEPETAPPDAPPDNGTTPPDRGPTGQAPDTGNGQAPEPRTARLQLAEHESALVAHAIALHGTCWRDERRRIREWLKAGVGLDTARDAIARGEHRPRGRI
jgi:uncharacterized protein YdaU (DUF1376 family)